MAHVRGWGVGGLLESVTALAGARSAFYQLQSIYSPWPFPVKKDLAIMIHALVTSRFVSCNGLYMGLPHKTLIGARKEDNINSHFVRFTRTPYMFPCST